MKHIVIIGACDSGKSSTIGSIIEQLKPQNVYAIDLNTKTKKQIDNSTKLHNGTYVVEVNGVLILVCAGAPTEQGYSITIIIEIVQVIFKSRIVFAIVSKRLREKGEYSTLTELVAVSKCLHTERIAKIPGTTTETLASNAEFIQRVKQLCAIISSNI